MKLIVKTMNDYNNIREVVLYSRANFSNRPAFFLRNKTGYDKISYEKFTTDILKLGASLIDRGYSGGKHIAMIGENSYQWLVTALAVCSSGNILVPVDKELPEDDILNVVKSSDSEMMLFANSYSDVIERVKSELSLEVIIFDKPTSKLTEISTQALIEGYTSEDYLDKCCSVPIVNDNMSCIVYTSGTTGMSKGVMLSHTNLISDVKCCFELAEVGDCKFSLLPMHHTYEFVLGTLFFMANGSANAINNSIKYISQNLKIFSPTDLVIVPLIAETLHNSIWNNIRNSGKEKLVKRMITVTAFLMKFGIDIRKKVFKEVHAALGGRVINIICGGAPIDPDIARSYVDFGFNFNIGYGITECSPLISGNCDQNRKKMDSCGRPGSCNEVKIDNPDEKGEGEIMAKGTNVMLGYYKNPEATAAVMRDGWFGTGDIGRFDKQGMLYVTGRVKNLIVLKNGKNIYPEELELLMYRIDLVKEAVVYSLEGENGEETAIAVEIYPDMEKVENNNITEYKKVIEEEIDKINSSLPYYKRIAYIGYRDNEFEKTTTKKIKRDKINGKQK